jgi:hypothetical protein
LRARRHICGGCRHQRARIAIVVPPIPPTAIKDDLLTASWRFRGPEKIRAVRGTSSPVNIASSLSRLPHFSAQLVVRTRDASTRDIAGRGEFTSRILSLRNRFKSRSTTPLHFTKVTRVGRILLGQFGVIYVRETKYSACARIEKRHNHFERQVIVLRLHRSQSDNCWRILTRAIFCRYSRVLCSLLRFPSLNSTMSRALACGKRTRRSILLRGRAGSQAYARVTHIGRCAGRSLLFSADRCRLRANEIIE